MLSYQVLFDYFKKERNRLIQAFENMSNEEIASAVNLVAGQDWSLDDAQQIRNLAAQVDEEAIDALSELDVQNTNLDPKEVVETLDEVGITVTDHQVDLVTGLLDSVKDINLGDLGSLIPGLGLALATDLPTLMAWSSMRVRSWKGCEFGRQTRVALEQRPPPPPPPVTTPFPLPALTMAAE